jgi:tetratricopeptide (TPR) repeat protein
MRKKFFIIVVPGLLLGVLLTVVVATAFKTRSAPESALLQPFSSTLSSAADSQIQTAQSTIRQYPGDSRGYNALAAAFMQKSRESGDFTLNTRAEDCLKRSLDVAPDNYDAIKLQATLMLTYHRFADALEIARHAQAMNAKDHDVYGALVDALVELGEYDQAVDAAQKMVDLRPDTASYSRVSYLRSLHGDTKGAIEMMRMAAESANPGNPESVAWCRVHLGDELVNDGKLAEAEHEYDHALFVFPNYHTALAAKARARYAAGDKQQAIAFYKRAIERTPLPDYIAALGDLYAQAGREDDARQQYEQVEFIEKLGSNAGTYSRQLALFWADHDIRLDEALSIAQSERSSRNDIYASDILAWTLYKKGMFANAQAAITEALRLKTKDPKLLYHAGLIAAANGDPRAGAEYLKQALEINPFFDVRQAEIARTKMAEFKRA